MKSISCCSAAASSSVDALTLSISPLRPCVPLFQASMPSSTSSLWWMTSTGPSMRGVRSGPVTTTAISSRRSFSGSRPLISQSSQTRFWSLFFRVAAGAAAVGVDGFGHRAIVVDDPARERASLRAKLDCAMSAPLSASLLFTLAFAARAGRRPGREVLAGHAPGAPCGAPSRRGAARLRAGHHARGAPEGGRLHDRQDPLRPARDGLGRGGAAGLDPAGRPRSAQQGCCWTGWAAACCSSWRCWPPSR